VSPVPSTIGASATSLPIRMAPITCAPWAASNGHGELGVAAGWFLPGRRPRQRSGLFRSRRGIGQVSKLKHERQPEVAHFDSTHGDQPPSAPSAGPMSRASKPG